MPDRNCSHCGEFGIELCGYTFALGGGGNMIQIFVESNFW